MCSWNYIWKIYNEQRNSLKWLGTTIPMFILHLQLKSSWNCCSKRWTGKSVESGGRSAPPSGNRWNQVDLGQSWTCLNRPIKAECDGQDSNRSCSSWHSHSQRQNWKMKAEIELAAGFIVKLAIRGPEHVDTNRHQRLLFFKELINLLRGRFTVSRIDSHISNCHNNF